MAEEVFFRMREIDKIYPLEGENVHALKKVSLTVEEGDYLSVLGPSGSGKTTLMNIIGCLDTPTSGEYILRGREVEDMDEQELAELRNREIGFIFQNSQLLPRLTARKNVELPLIYAGIRPKERRERAEAMLERVGLKDRMDHRPASFPAASSSVWLSPGQWWAIHLSCWRMNPPAPWTRKQAPR